MILPFCFLNLDRSFPLMGGDAMLHHSGNSTRFDYITRAFKAGHYLKSRRIYLISEQHAAIIVIF